MVSVIWWWPSFRTQLAPPVYKRVRLWFYLYNCLCVSSIWFVDQASLLDISLHSISEYCYQMSSPTGSRLLLVKSTAAIFSGLSQIHHRENLSSRFFAVSWKHEVTRNGTLELVHMAVSSAYRAKHLPSVFGMWLVKRKFRYDESKKTCWTPASIQHSEECIFPSLARKLLFSRNDSINASKPEWILASNSLWSKLSCQSLSKALYTLRNIAPVDSLLLTLPLTCSTRWSTWQPNCSSGAEI